METPQFNNLMDSLDKLTDEQIEAVQDYLEGVVASREFDIKYQIKEPTADQL